MNKLIFNILSLLLLLAFPKEVYSQNSADELIKKGKTLEEEGKDLDALQLYKQAAEMNNPEGMFLYGDMLRFGDRTLAEKKRGLLLD